MFNVCIHKACWNCFGGTIAISDSYPLSRESHFFLLFPYCPNTRRKILALHNKAVFCACSTFILIPIASTYASNCFETAPNAPTTTGMISTFLMLQSLAISSRNGRYLPIFSLFASPQLLHPLELQHQLS